ncbi:MAG: hypothetical protein QM820_43180 [Minicystis sp.]
MLFFRFCSACLSSSAACFSSSSACASFSSSSCAAFAASAASCCFWASRAFASESWTSRILDGLLDVLDRLLLVAPGVVEEEALGEVLREGGVLEGQLRELAFHVDARGVERVDELLARADVAEAGVVGQRLVAELLGVLAERIEGGRLGGERREHRHPAIGQDAGPVLHFIELPIQHRPAEFAARFALQQLLADLAARQPARVVVHGAGDAQYKPVEPGVRAVHHGLRLGDRLQAGELLGEDVLEIVAQPLEGRDERDGDRLRAELGKGVEDLAKDVERTCRVADGSCHGSRRYGRRRAQSKRDL